MRSDQATLKPSSAVPVKARSPNQVSASGAKGISSVYAYITLGPNRKKERSASWWQRML